MQAGKNYSQQRRVILCKQSDKAERATLAVGAKQRCAISIFTENSAKLEGYMEW